MRQVAARHDALLDDIITQHHGRRVKERGEGDSVFATFADPAAAVAAALAINQAVLAESWPAETPIKVRMSLHTGIAQWREGDYYGPVVNRCARIRGLGHGGQVLLSAATAVLVRDRLPEGARLRALGAHSLKGLSAPEEVFQLCHPALPAEFPPLVSPQAPKHNLPQALTCLIGREAEQGEVLALLAEARLVTLVGSGGVGKTRLALAVASELVDQYADGVWLLELAALADPTLVVGAVAQALGLREEPGLLLLTTLSEHLKAKQLLLVLDNCEHLIGACADLVSAVLRACPAVRLLATSREGLEVAGERRYRVPSLPVPDLTHLPPPERLAESAAVALFLARARERRPDLALTALTARAVAQICARLDGIPLAIELAAARVSSLAVEGIAARLGGCFRLLTGGGRDVLPRQRTLRATLDWSYDLLGEGEQRLLDRLSVFAGGCTLEAAEAVCTGDGVEGWQVLDLLSGLVNKSLVQLEEAPGQPEQVRYRLLDTVRQYGQERLEACGEAAEVRTRHLAWCVALAEQAALALLGPEQAAWLAQLEMEHDNLRAALGWSTQDSRDGASSIRLAGALGRFWHIRGHLSEGRGWLEGALAHGVGSAAARALALHWAGNLAYVQGNHGQAGALFEESLALRRALEDRHGIAASLNCLGNVAQDQGEYWRAKALFEEGLALKRELQDRRGVARVLNNLGSVACLQGDVQQAAALYQESLAIERELGDKAGIAKSLNNLGELADLQGNAQQAAALFEESLTLTRVLGDQFVIAIGLLNLGRITHLQSDDAHARAYLAEGLTVARGLDNRRLLAYALERMAMVAGAQGAPEQAATLFGAAAALREVLGTPLDPNDRAAYDRAAATISRTLGPDGFAAAWAAGQALPLGEAITLALEKPARSDA
jgi:predicted ATPase/Tfp pilus assembly protein PilF